MPWRILSEPCRNIMSDANVVARHTSSDRTECCTGHTNLISLVVVVVAATIRSVQHSRFSAPSPGSPPAGRPEAKIPNQRSQTKGPEPRVPKLRPRIEDLEAKEPKPKKFQNTLFKVKISNRKHQSKDPKPKALNQRAQSQSPETKDPKRKT